MTSWATVRVLGTALVAAFVTAGCAYAGSGFSSSNGSDELPVPSGEATQYGMLRREPTLRASLQRGHSATVIPSHKALAYVADPSKNEIAVYTQKGSNQNPIGYITNGADEPVGLFVDADKNLYASDWGTDTVTVYAPGSDSPSETLTAPSGAINPGFLVVGRDGTVYVGFEAYQGSNGGVVVAYAKGRTAPSRNILTFTGETFPEGLALDSRNNLYVAVAFSDSSGYNGFSGKVLEVKAGGSHGKDLGIRINALPGGMTIDMKNDLVLAVQAQPGSVNIYPPGKKNPSGVISVNLPAGVALNHKNTKLFVNSDSTSSTFVFAYPTGKQVDQFAPLSGYVTGVATSPDGSY